MENAREGPANRRFELDGETLLVPGFSYLGTELLHASEVSPYLDSILEFDGYSDGRLAALRRHRRPTGEYPTTEAGVLSRRPSDNGHISEDEGLLLVREACDELESQVSRLAE